MIVPENMLHVKTMEDTHLLSKMMDRMSMLLMDILRVLRYNSFGSFHYELGRKLCISVALC